ncbi:MAG: KpsF/GutQ family sugar-phosphate isomerase [Desulfobacterales bacterium]
MEAEDILAQAANVLKIEADGILGVTRRLDRRFVQAVEAIYASRGRLIVSGIGKSGIIGRKLVATLNSTGTRALFLHPVEAMHGDLGMVSGEDIFLALSNSGETQELTLLIPSIRHTGCQVLAFTGNLRSTLAQQSDIVVDTGVDQEACPLGLAPTASTTALLAVGDALAVVLQNKRRFNSKDFRRNHPGGTLGQQLALQVGDLMLSGTKVPRVTGKVPMSQALTAMDQGGLGAVLVVDDQDHLKGIITDGDLRRLIIKTPRVDQLTVQEAMTPDPKSATPWTPAYDALHLMERHQITVLPITDTDRRVRGILHLHDILGKGALKFNGVPAAKP